MADLSKAVFTTAGPVRDQNEDAAGVAAWGIIVCDGMGGHAHGEQASRVIVQEFMAGSSIEKIDAEAHSWVRALAPMGQGRSSPGTTCSLARFSGDVLMGLHVGDSGLFLLSQDPAQPLRRLTPSDSLGDMILAQDPTDVAVARRFRHVLDRGVIGDRPLTWHRCPRLRYAPGDWIVGATDGVIDAYDYPDRPLLDLGRFEADLRRLFVGETTGNDLVETAASVTGDNATLALWRTPRPKAPRKK